MDSAWARVGVNFYRHPKTRRLSKDAQHLYLASILHCVEFGTDGRFPADETQYMALVSRVRPSLSEELFDAGAWTQTGDEIEVHNFLKWQTPDAVRKARSDAGKKAAEARWSNVDAEGIADRNANGNAKKRREEEEKNSSERDPDFDRFWAVYPRKAGKGTASKKWKAAVERAGSAERVIEGAQAYADHVAAHETDPHFIAHPTTWLNGDRWDDELPPPLKRQDPFQAPKQVIH